MREESRKLCNPYSLSPQQQVMRYGRGYGLDGDAMHRDFTAWLRARGESVDEYYRRRDQCKLVGLAVLVSMVIAGVLVLSLML